jgi:hypothetical protein
MKYEIHFYPNESYGQDDYFVISGKTIEEIQANAKKELQKRGINPNECWSKKIEGEVSNEFRS